MDHTLTFGKHKGKLISLVAEESPKYIAYLLSGAADKFLKTEGKVCCLDKIPNLKLGFGRHRDKTYQQVKDEHPDYLEWLMKQVGYEWVENYLKINV